VPLLGPEARADRAEEPCGHAHGSDRRRAPRPPGRALDQAATAQRAHLRPQRNPDIRRPGARDPRHAKAWTAAKLTPITLHELRHSCASVFIAAGVNAKALSSYLGHASVTINLWPLRPPDAWSEDEAVKLVDDYIERATGAQTGAQGTETAPLRRL